MNRADAVPLDEARRRVGETMHVDPEWWEWTPGEIRWLVSQWEKTRPLAPPLDPPAGSLLRQVVDGLHWWLIDSPRILRVMTAFLAVFAYGFAWGWGNG